MEDLEKDLHFLPGSSALLKEWNQLDQLLVVWGGVLLRLDSAFHMAVAVAEGHTTCAKRADGSSGASKGSVGSVTEALASIGLQVSRLYAAMTFMPHTYRPPDSSPTFLHAAYRP